MSCANFFMHSLEVSSGLAWNTSLEEKRRLNRTRIDSLLEHAPASRPVASLNIREVALLLALVAVVLMVIHEHQSAGIETFVLFSTRGAAAKA